MLTSILLLVNINSWRGTAQDIPFDLILWYIAKKFPFCRNWTNSWCRAHMYILTYFPPSYVVSKIGLSTIRSFLIHICFQMLLSRHLIMFCVLFWCRIRKNVHFEGIYLFPMHQNTATSNSTIRRHCRYITSTHKTLRDGALSGVGKSLWGRLWLWFKSPRFSNIRQYTTVTNQC